GHDGLAHRRRAHHPRQIEPRFGQRFLSGFALGHVLYEADEVVDGAVVATHAFGGHDRMDHATVLAYPSLVERVAIDLAVQHTSVLLDVRCDIVRMRHLGPRHPQQLVAFVTEDIAELLVHFDDALGYGRDRHADQAELEIAPESIFAHAQDFLGALPLD